MRAFIRQISPIRPLALAGRIAVLVPCCVVLAACSGAGTPFFSGAPALAPTRISATDAYSRIARGANACWLGENGPLKGKYMFYADAQPDSKGGAAEIRIYEREADGRPSSKAYGVMITPGGERASVSPANVKLPAEVAKRMDGDVERWAEGGVGCQKPGDGGWAASPQDAGATPIGEPAKPAKAQPVTANRPG